MLNIVHLASVCVLWAVSLCSAGTIVPVTWGPTQHGSIAIVNKDTIRFNYQGRNHTVFQAASFTHWNDCNTTEGNQICQSGIDICDVTATDIPQGFVVYLFCENHCQSDGQRLQVSVSSAAPSASPTSSKPSASPSHAPTRSPTHLPSKSPSKAPTLSQPSVAPSSSRPSVAPSSSPTSVACANGVKDSGESDVDCGGEFCRKCANGKTCIQSDNCLSGFCNQDSHKCSFTSAPVSRTTSAASSTSLTFVSPLLLVTITAFALLA